MKTLLETCLYHLLNKNPTNQLSCKHTDELLSLKQSVHLSETINKKIKLNLGTNSHLGSTAYLRYTSPTYRSDQLYHAYDLSAYLLANILSPLTGKSDYSVINSRHFMSTISHEKVHDNEVMVSFDIEL